MRTIYFFESNRKGVSKIKKRLVTNEQITAHRIEDKKRIPIWRYDIEESPFHFDIIDGESFSQEDGYASGFGDLWEWSYFGSFDKKVLEDVRKKEVKRVRKKYTSIKAKIKRKIKNKVENW